MARPSGVVLLLVAVTLTATASRLGSTVRAAPHDGSQSQIQHGTASSKKNVLEYAEEIFLSPLPLPLVVFLLFGPPIIAYVGWRWYQKQDDAPLGLHTWVDRAIYVGYISLFLSWSCLTHFTKDGKHSSAMLIFVTQLFKLFFSVIFYRAFDGTFSELVADARKGYRSLCYYALPAALYAISDVMRVDVLRRVEPSTYTILFNMRMLFLALVWEQVLNRRLKTVHWCGLFLIFAGCVMKELPHVWKDGSVHDAIYKDANRTLAYTEILVMGIFSALAAVMNEKLLKHEKVPVNLQNFSMYAFSLIPITIVSCFAMTGAHAQAVPDVINPVQWRAVFTHPLVIAQAINFALFGILTGHFLKRFSNIMREVATGMIILFVIIVDAVFFKYAVHLIVCLGAMLVAAAIMVFAVYPVPPAPTADEKLQSRTCCRWQLY